jgi:hypothetical protein
MDEKLGKFIDDFGALVQLAQAEATGSRKACSCFRR